MIIKNDVRYRIDVLLQMARISTDEEKRNEYLLSVEELMTGEYDTQQLSQLEIPFGDEKKMNVVNAFVDMKGVHKIKGNTTESVYQEYVSFCENDAHDSPLQKCSFSKYLKKCTGIFPYQKKINGENIRMYHL